MSANEQVIRLLRAQAWERAKGELRSMLPSYTTGQNARPYQFENMKDAIDEFIEKVESEGLEE